MDSVNRSIEVVLGGKNNTRKVIIGGNAPVTVQTMWKEPLIGADLGKVAARLENLHLLGCNIVRFAVPDEQSAGQLVKLSGLTAMPLTADIHFDYKLALLCMEGCTAKIRINPGNIGGKKNIKAVIDKAKATGTAVRIGVNSGSLPQDLIKRIEKEKENPDIKAQMMAEAALRELSFLDELNFNNAVVSIKASGIGDTVSANRIFAKQRRTPLHLGVTEAGPLISGIVKSTAAFSQLFAEGIGSTIRVSLSDTPENEVIAGREILSVCGKRSGGVKIISCPRCGRRGFDVRGFVARWQNKLLMTEKDITVAVMGCEVNGPGESKKADLGITGSPVSAVIFKRGEIVRRINLKNLGEKEKTRIIDEAFEKELEEL